MIDMKSLVMKVNILGICDLFTKIPENESPNFTMVNIETFVLKIYIYIYIKCYRFIVIGMCGL